MYEIDFLPVENEDGDSSKSGDAIAMRFTAPDGSGPYVVAIDGGFTPVGAELADHIETYYGTTKIDLVISTHPDTDHLNGLLTLLERCDVTELLMHLPWKHNDRAKDMGNYERIRAVYDLAVSKDVLVSEPFTGGTRLQGAISILGPTEEFYSTQLATSIDESSSASFSARGLGSTLLAKATKVLERVLSYFPSETLSDADETSARNKTSVITLLRTEGYSALFTGDAGIPSLEAATLEYERIVGEFRHSPVSLFQAPHHGSHRNVGPTILNKILGTPDAPFGGTNAIVSSAKASEKHPSPKVTNALGRRGAKVSATEGKTICYSDTRRPGWSATTPISPLEEDDE
jgi:beta-lactamase superfamily II metal-dependent hydrolase